MLSRLDRILHKPLGWAARSRILGAVLRLSKHWVACDWMQEPEDSSDFGFAGSRFSPGMNVRQENRSFSDTLRAFYTKAGRWPTNIAEAHSYAMSEGRPELPARFEDATMVVSPDGGIQITYSNANGGGRMELSKAAASAARPFPANVAARMKEARRRSAQQQDDLRTLQFIVLNFQAHFGRWPKDTKELAAFAARHSQPEIPSRFSDATFTTTPEGRIEVRYDGGNATARF